MWVAWDKSRSVAGACWRAMAHLQQTLTDPSPRLRKGGTWMRVLQEHGVGAVQDDPRENPAPERPDAR